MDMAIPLDTAQLMRGLKSNEAHDQTPLVFCFFPAHLCWMVATVPVQKAYVRQEISQKLFSYPFWKLYSPFETSWSSGHCPPPGLTFHVLGCGSNLGTSMPLYISNKVQSFWICTSLRIQLHPDTSPFQYVSHAWTVHYYVP